MFKSFGVSVTQQNGQLVVHNPISIFGCVIAVFLAFVLLIWMYNFTENPFRAAKVGRAVAFYLLKVAVFILLLFGFAFSVQSNDLTLNAGTHTATDVDRYLYFFKTTNTYDLSRIQRAEVYGSRDGGADRLCLVFANGHLHSLTSNNNKFGKNEAAMAINNYLATAR